MLALAAPNQRFLQDWASALSISEHGVTTRVNTVAKLRPKTIDVDNSLHDYYEVDDDLLKFSGASGGELNGDRCL